MGEHLRYTLSLVNEWIRFAEAKNAALLALGAGAIYTTARLLASHTFGSALYVYVVLALLQAAVAVLFALLSFLPQVKTGRLFALKAPEEKDSFFHYGDIAKYDPELYLAKLREELGETEEATKAHLDLAGQVVINSRIALRKYRCFAIGAWLMVSAVATPVLALILWAAGEDE